LAPIRIPRKSWIIVCDGAKALILRNEGDADLMNLQVMETVTQPDEKTRELGTDRPGRANNPPGTARSAMEQTDWHMLAEEDFLSGIAERIGRIVEEHQPGTMVLVAPPQALGYLRNALPANARKAITAEIAKDYTQMPVPDIERNLLKLAA